MNFKKYYTFPLQKLYSKVLTVSMNMAFDFPYEKKNGLVISEKKQNIILDILNDFSNSEDISFIPKNLYYDENSSRIKFNDTTFIIIRGWGNLTGVGGHQLSNEKAIAIQKEFANWIIKKLNK